VPLTEERAALLQQVNSHVNSTIREVPDLEQYGRDDVWALPTSGKGDCEDFALLKRKLLIERGFPASALAIDVGLTDDGEPHAVLTVSTTKGDYVLDNLHSAVLPADRSKFTAHSRQRGRRFVAVSGEVSHRPTIDLPISTVSKPLKVAQRATR
jgi:predicted transglutaminase-like cysteine proteinase